MHAADQTDRRGFLRRTAQFARLATGATLLGGARSTFVAAEPVRPSGRDIVDIEPRDGGDLQRRLLDHAGRGCVVRLRDTAELTCVVREDDIEGEKSIHALLVPHGVQLDLNGSSLLLDMRSNSYGVRLSNDSAIRNGTIRVVRSEGKGSQACWHSGISVGAAYGDGGTAARPGRYSRVANWAIDRVTIDQPFAAAAIQLMSEACQGSITRVEIKDSDQALLGIGMDWGSVGPMTSVDAELPEMRRLWERGEIYSTHPHDIRVENIRIGKLLRSVDANDAGVRCSACHRITIRNIDIEAAATAIAIFGGDCGYEYAAPAQRSEAHQDYRVEQVRITRALQFGLVLNGSADNIWRAVRAHGYRPLLDPVHPGIERAVFRELRLQGVGAARSQGIYAVSLRNALLEKLEISGFDLGVHVEDWVEGMQFRGCTLRDNQRDTAVEGATEPARGVEFLP